MSSAIAFAIGLIDSKSPISALCTYDLVHLILQLADMTMKVAVPLQLVKRRPDGSIQGLYKIYPNDKYDGDLHDIVIGYDKVGTYTFLSDNEYGLFFSVNILEIEDGESERPVSASAFFVVTISLIPPDEKPHISSGGEGSIDTPDNTLVWYDVSLGDRAWFKAVERNDSGVILKCRDIYGDFEFRFAVGKPWEITGDVHTPLVILQPIRVEWKNPCHLLSN